MEIVTIINNTGTGVCIFFKICSLQLLADLFYSMYIVNMYIAMEYELNNR